MHRLAFTDKLWHCTCRWSKLTICTRNSYSGPTDFIFVICSCLYCSITAVFSSRSCCKSRVARCSCTFANVSSRIVCSRGCVFCLMRLSVSIFSNRFVRCNLTFWSVSASIWDSSCRVRVLEFPRRTSRLELSVSPWTTGLAGCCCSAAFGIE